MNVDEDEFYVWLKRFFDWDWAAYWAGYREFEDQQLEGGK